jgi:hypothetical protein
LIFDLIEHRRIKKYSHELAPRISLFTKIVLLGFAVMTITGIAFSFILEYAYTGVVFIVDPHDPGPPILYYDIAHYEAFHGEFGQCDTLNRI